jgi:hypothetical protein
MMWLTWRQHRMEAAAAAAFLAVCAVILLGTGLHIHSLYDGVAGCMSAANPDVGCSSLVSDFDSAVESNLSFLIWLNFAPAFVGVFIGAPLLARELESGTHRFAWTQSITRGRWLGVKLALLVPVVIGFAALFTALFTWWLWPAGHTRGPFEAAFFDFQGVTPIAYSLFAFALGVAVGAVLGRTVVAMAVTLGVFLAVRLPVEFAGRAHYMTPITQTASLTALSQANGTTLSDGAPQGAWILSRGFVDATGNSVSPSGLGSVCPPPPGKDSGVLNTCFAQHGIFSRVVYQPADRWWSFQLIEAGIFVVLAAALITLAVGWVRRRTV